MRATEHQSSNKSHLSNAVIGGAAHARRPQAPEKASGNGGEPRATELVGRRLRGGAHRIASEQEALARTRAAAIDIAAGAAERDRDRLLPAQEIERISSEGLLAVTVPAAHGGAEVSFETLAEMFLLLGAADPNVAQLPHSHFVYLELVRQLASAEAKEQIFAEVLDGRRLANAQSEAGSKTVRDIRTTVSRDGASGYVIEGEKFYCTGSLLADWLMVLAKGEDDETYVAVVPHDAEGVTIVDDWAGMGQRTTASGTVKLEGVPVAPAMLIAHHRLFERPQVYGARAQLLHAAIDAGIAAGALADGTEFVRTASRPWFEAEVERASEDALTVQRVGELELDVRAAAALVREAARTIDEVEAMGVDEQGAARASIAVATAKAFADRVSVQSASAIFELAGTRSAADTLNLHRHWRNARTHTLHDPVRWKLQHIGRYVLNGTLPPSHGQL